MAELLDAVGRVLPWVAGAVCLIGGAIALRMIGREPLRARADLRAARRGAAVLGFVVGLPAGAVGAMIGSSFSPGGVDPLRFALGVVLLGTPVFGLVVGASMAGYAALGRLRPGGDALAGVVLGPLLAGGLVVGGIAMVGAAQQISAEERARQEAAEVEGRSSGLHLAVEGVEASVNDAGLVTRVTLRALVASDADLEMEQLPGKLTYPLFVLQPTGREDPATDMTTEASPGSPPRLVAGATTSYDLVFDAQAGGQQLSKPGAWRLVMTIGGADGQVYGGETAIDVGG